MPIVDGVEFVSWFSMKEAPVGSLAKDYFGLTWVKGEYGWCPKMSRPTQAMIDTFGPWLPVENPTYHKY